MIFERPITFACNPTRVQFPTAGGSLANRAVQVRVPTLTASKNLCMEMYGGQTTNAGESYGAAMPMTKPSEVTPDEYFIYELSGAMPLRTSNNPAALGLFVAESGVVESTAAGGFLCSYFVPLIAQNADKGIHGSVRFALRHNDLPSNYVNIYAGMFHRNDTGAGATEVWHGYINCHLMDNRPQHRSPMLSV